uniref:Adenosine/AMP deaminase N-terminal domain-containing protein n=1 Tax=Octopus bimaculoides TaxID=37653 RepID=A0A0L8GZ74_OCTBM
MVVLVVVFLHKFANMKILQSSCITLLSMLCILPMIILSSTDETYETERREIINKENDQRFGSHLTLNRDERQVNDYLMKLKDREMKLYESGVEMYPSSMLFTDAKKQIDRSKIFHFLQKMPKGGLLHVHGSAMASVDWLISFATYMPNCYMCWDREKYIVYKFLFCPKLPPKIRGCAWERVCHARKYHTEGVIAFDEMLVNAITFNSSKLSSVESDQNDIWNTFEQYFMLTRNLIRYKPVFSKYIHQGLIELFKDNIQHFEIRMSLSSGHKHPGRECLLALGRLRRRGFQLIRSTEQPAREINVQVAEHSTDTCTLNVVLGDIQRDTV